MYSEAPHLVKQVLIKLYIIGLFSLLTLHITYTYATEKAFGGVRDFPAHLPLSLPPFMYELISLHSNPAAFMPSISPYYLTGKYNASLS